MLVETLAALGLIVVVWAAFGRRRGTPFERGERFGEVEDRWRGADEDTKRFRRTYWVFLFGFVALFVLLVVVLNVRAYVFPAVVLVFWLMVAGTVLVRRRS